MDFSDMRSGSASMRDRDDDAAEAASCGSNPAEEEDLPFNDDEEEEEEDDDEEFLVDVEIGQCPWTLPATTTTTTTKKKKKKKKKKSVTFAPPSDLASIRSVPSLLGLSRGLGGEGGSCGEGGGVSGGGGDDDAQQAAAAHRANAATMSDLFYTRSEFRAFRREVERELEQHRTLVALARSGGGGGGGGGGGRRRQGRQRRRRQQGVVAQQDAEEHGKKEEEEEASDHLSTDMEDAETCGGGDGSHSSVDHSSECQRRGSDERDLERGGRNYVDDAEVDKEEEDDDVFFFSGSSLPVHRCHLDSHLDSQPVQKRAPVCGETVPKKPHHPLLRWPSEERRSSRGTYYAARTVLAAAASVAGACYAGSSMLMTAYSSR